MDTASIVPIATAVLLAFFILGMPIILCLGFWAAIVAFFGSSVPAISVGNGAYFGLQSFALLAMPLFILTGDLVREGGIAQQLIDLARAALRRVPGRLPVAALGASGMFSAISGSNAATAATIGRMMVPAMLKENATREYAGAVTAAGGTLGIMIPPSVMLIVYGVLMNVSPSTLFLAALIPGLLMLTTMIIITVIIGKRLRLNQDEKEDTNVSTLSAAWKAKNGFGAILIGLGGIYGGIFSPTEAAGAAAAYCLVAGLLFTRELRPSRLGSILVASGSVAGLIAPIIAFAVVVQESLVMLGLQETIWEAIRSVAAGQSGILVLAMVSVLVAGCLLESIPCIIILAPIFGPLAVEAGVDPIHFAIVFVMGSTLGFITPPYGLNLFVVSGVTGAPIMKISKAIMPYLAGLIVMWIVTATIPALTTLW
ncbi:TRAP transporter large permease [Ectothiorhodospiraceae bacterium WFHF3C12]|nr:TRAP transporter large permease [Ectothiorhodospiraceae bacterium WFHF3C12]